MPGTVTSVWSAEEIRRSIYIVRVSLSEGVWFKIQWHQSPSLNLHKLLWTRANLCELTPRDPQNREGIMSWLRNWISRFGFVSSLSPEKVWFFCGSHCTHGNFKQGKKPARIYSLQPSRNIRATSACNHLPWLKSWLDPLVAAYLEACIAWTNRANILVARSTQKTL